MLLVLGPPKPAPTACCPRAPTGRPHQVEHSPVLGLAASRNEQEQWQSQRALQLQHGAGPCGKVARRAERPAKQGRDHPVAISWRRWIRDHEEGCLMSLVGVSKTVRAAEACPRTRGVVELPARRARHDACSVDGLRSRNGVHALLAACRTASPAARPRSAVQNAALASALAAPSAAVRSSVAAHARSCRSSRWCRASASCFSVHAAAAPPMAPAVSEGARSASAATFRRLCANHPAPVR